MASNLVITFTAPVSIKVDFGDYIYADPSLSKVHVFNARMVENVRTYQDNSDMVKVEMSEVIDGCRKVLPLTWRSDFHTVYPGAVAFVVDTIDGVAPVSTEDLLDKIAALMQ